MFLLLINSLIFILIFLTICNWFQILSFLSIIVGPKYRTSSIDDKWIKSVVKKKTKLSLPNITIFHDKKMYGMMAGLPFWPKMILSEGLYKSFNRDELEWVVLHEAGHCVLWHNLQAFIIQISILFFGIYTILRFNFSIFIVPFYATLLSVICVQILRWGIEYVADRYSINRVDDPQGVITAQNKFRNAYDKSLIYGEKRIFRTLLAWNISYSRRIIMAKERMASLR